MRLSRGAFLLTQPTDYQLLLNEAVRFTARYILIHTYTHIRANVKVSPTYTT